MFNQTGVTVGSYSWNTAWSLTTGLWCAGGGVGALLGGPAAEKLGRKWSLLLNNLFLLLGSALQVVPDVYFVFHLNILLSPVEKAIVLT